jgi:hypothetical protein
VRKIGHKKICYSLEGELDIFGGKSSLSNRDPYD